MVNAARLLEDLKRLRKRLDADLRQHHAASAGRAAVEAEWRAARDSKRTADTVETFFGAAVDQAAVHWVLALVFLRFLEDNGLLDRPAIGGTGERLELAQVRQREHFRAHPADSDAEYLLALFGTLAVLPGLAGLYDPAHNPLFRLPVSGDGARLLFDFFRQPAPGTDAPLHDFTDAAADTRFLGDLYQDLSEDARKRYALLQTPDFVEEWILSRTLDQAIREFGYAQVRMIDPACGSGHFLLGGFARLLAQWRHHAPEMPPAAQAQRALDAVAGVDLNPFAVAVARFRLLVAALHAAGITRLAAAPDFRLAVATGDSLLHGRHFFRGELGGAAEGFGRVLRHHYAAEDDAVGAILGRQYHAVVGNPPYITPKDAAMRDAYREIYRSCHMKYGLGAPFTERFFDLAQGTTERESAGFVGLIVANSFMKREFGKRLIEAVLPRLDVTHVVDCSGAYIPGHGTPTAILFGRNRAPVASVVRTVRGVRGEPGAPADPAQGLVWSAIVAQADHDESDSAFISTEDTPRAVLARHPWNMGGGGAAEVQEAIEGDWPRLASLGPEVGPASFTGGDDVLTAPIGTYQRSGVPQELIRPLVGGEQVRDYNLIKAEDALAPYSTDNKLIPLNLLGGAATFLWPYRTTLAGIISFGQRTKGELGEPWWSWYRWIVERYRTPLSITFAFVATMNHFALDRGTTVFNRTAPLIKLPNGASENDYLGILALLNSSTACFWLQQVCHNKGAGGGTRVASGHSPMGDEGWESHFEHDGGKIGRFPLAAEYPLDIACALDVEAHRLLANLPAALCARAVPTRETLDTARAEAESARTRMIALQEELDWRCYRLYALHEAPPEHPSPPPLHLGERAFEIVMARRIEAGELETAWFSRHRSTPITALPAHWPADYRAAVERRIALIEADATIGLIERPEYKRRWSAEPWEAMEQDALRTWLLDRLEHPRFWPAEDPQIVTARSLADATRGDAEFQAVAALYAGRAAFDVDALVAELVAAQSVPFLAALRYSETGLRKRADWEATWDRQRAEDAIDTALAAGMAPGPARDAEAKRRKAAEVGDIPVPPKYRTPDFRSASFWALRGGLDVPKERFVSFPHCARDADPSLPVLWAGHGHLARARALAALYVERRDNDGWPSARLAPMLAGLGELVPWLVQWHNEIDVESGLRMGEYFAGFIAEEARERGLTEAGLHGWAPPAPVRGRARRLA